METALLKDLPKGEYFKRKPDAKKVYQRGEYCRSRRKYQADDCDDICRELVLKGSTVVYIGFTY
jgi:hypothetical protein